MSTYNISPAKQAAAGVHAALSRQGFPAELIAAALPGIVHDDPKISNKARAILAKHDVGYGDLGPTAQRERADLAKTIRAQVLDMGVSPSVCASLDQVYAPSDRALMARADEIAGGRPTRLSGFVGDRTDPQDPPLRDTLRSVTRYTVPSRSVSLSRQELASAAARRVLTSAIVKRPALRAIDLSTADPRARLIERARQRKAALAAPAQAVDATLEAGLRSQSAKDKRAAKLAANLAFGDYRN